MSTPATTSQTVGPYFSIGLSYRNGIALCTQQATGEHIEITGQVFDGHGLPVPDAQLELWQADPHGRFGGYDPLERGTPVSGFEGFARVPTDAIGGFHVHTVFPGTVPAANGKPQAPHIVVMLSMRGLLKHLYTRIIFANHPHNESDPVLSAVPAERRATLNAQPSEQDSKHYRWNIQLQGDNETVFFQY